MAHPMLRPGDRLGPYVVEAELGRGGAGVVVAARAVEPVAGPLHVAIKARLAADGPDAARFQREMGALRALRVPGTVRLHSAGQAGPIAWFSMDRVDGVDLRARAATHPEPAARGALVARLATTLLETVAGVHQRGFVHRDLKPGNVLVDGMDRVWLLDFGVARGWRSPTAALTHPGAVIGTLPYMAPEQVTGQTAGPEVDVFAAGLLLHEAIAGPRAPARAPQEWLARQCLEHLPPLAVSVPGTPSGLSAIVSAMLAFSPEDRPTAPECVDALRAIGSGSTAVPLRPAPPRFIGRDALVRSLTGSARIDGPTLVSFEGPAGSGKRRLAEAIRRRLLLRGMTGRRLQVRPHAPGAGLGALLSAMVTARPADPQDAAALSTVWPSLPGAPPPTQRAARRAVAEAAAHVIQQASETTPLVVEVRAAQDMDPLLADTLLLLARRAPTDLLILLCVDDRWPGPAWQRLVQKAGSTKLVRNPMPDLDETEAQALCASLGCPDAGGPGSPLRVAEAAWEDLARRSGTPRTVLPWALLPMALLDRPVPDAAVRALGAAPDALARQGLLRGEPEMGWMLADESVRTLARAHIMDRVAAATRLQAALEETRPQLFARAAQASRCGALDAAVRAAEDALDKRLGAVARSWLMLADTLPRPDAAEGQAGAFRRAAVRARVSLRTDRGPPREDLVAQAERRAAGPTEVLEAGLLRAELRWRQGDHAGARASLDAIAAEASLTAPSLSNRVRGRRACLELDAGQPAAALRACNRARRPDGTLSAWLAVVDRRASIWTGDPARALVSPSAPLVEARAHLLLGRPAASRAGLEVAWRTAMTRDGTTRAEARLLLARLELGDGRASVSRKMLEEVVLPRDAPAWLRPDRDAVALLLALFAGDTAAGDKLAVEPPACLPPDWAPLAVRWWRLRGRPSAGEAAIQAAATRLSGPWGRAMTDTLQAWVALATGDADAAAHAAARARDGAAKSGLADLGRQAQMLLAAARAGSDESWSYLSGTGARARAMTMQLDALELDAIRRMRRDDMAGAGRAWRRLAQVAGPKGWRLRARYARRQIHRLEGGPVVEAASRTLPLDGEQ